MSKSRKRKTSSYLTGLDYFFFLVNAQYFMFLFIFWKIHPMYFDIIFPNSTEVLPYALNSLNIKTKAKVHSPPEIQSVLYWPIAECSCFKSLLCVSFRAWSSVWVRECFDSSTYLALSSILEQMIKTFILWIPGVTDGILDPVFVIFINLLTCICKWIYT